jgi:hypothetical protein
LVVVPFVKEDIGIISGASMNGQQAPRFRLVLSVCAPRLADDNATKAISRVPARMIWIRGFMRVLGLNSSCSIWSFISTVALAR